ncbi:MAG TPA: uroporphyrinogen-III synthase [Xanthobacteraceae bacterium]|nr:uroporphyrinogen-III synthase [Xanthobacteraceae bacterium]
MRILVTRPQPGNAQTAVALQERGHEPIMAPLFEIEILSEVDPDAGPWNAILLTSANALRGLAGPQWREAGRGTPVFAVGDRTAKAARDQGFTEVASAGGNVDDLVNLVAARLKPPARLLYLAGQERSGDLAGALRARNFIVDAVVVYRMLTARTLSEPAATAIRTGVDGVLHFSRRSAEAFVRAVSDAGLLEAAVTKPVHYCLSDQVAEPLRPAGAANIRIAAHPDEDALLELL